MATRQNSVETIHRMIAAAASRSSSMEAMQISQAALNAAKALEAVALLPPDPTPPQR